MEKVIELKPKVGIKISLENKKFSNQFLPHSLYLESKVKKIEFKDQKLKTSYLIDIIHNLLLKYYFKKDNIFNLSSLVLKEKYGHLYNYYIDYLVQKEVIVLLKKHLKGKNARIYKLNESVINGEIKRFKNSDRILLKKYKNAVCSVENKEFNHNLILPEVKKKLVQDLFSVEIDYAKSIFFLDSSIQEVDIYNKNRYSVECIQDKHIFYHFDNYGRLHTNFTILKSFIRKNCLLIEGEETYEIDVKNSHPLFLNKVLKGSNIEKDAEFEFFKFLTMNGKFYQYLQEKLQIKDKKIVKEITYKVFFGKNYRNKLDTQFQNIFPKIHDFIKIFKKTSGDYKSLSYELQKYESNFIFNKVVKEISENYPNIKIVTVHDSLICKKSDKQIVEDIFNSYLQEEFNF
jgi:hypothetical protein